MSSTSPVGGFNGHHSGSICGFRPDLDGWICGQPATYEFQFADTGSQEFGLACDKHVLELRTFKNLKTVYSLKVSRIP